jgi:Xaa-Pro aminopeptidase
MAKAKKPGVPPALKKRLTAFRKPMKKRGANAFLLTNPVDYFYLTGFTGDESAVMITARDVLIISDRRFEEQLKHECPWARTYMRRGALNAEIAKACKDANVKKLGVQASRLSISDHQEIQKLAKGIKTIPDGEALAAMRRFKDTTEIATMNKALRVAETAFRTLRETIKPGQTEIEIAARLEYEMKSRGASGPSFPTIVAEGPNAALPHAHPGKRKVRKGSAILIDWGARVSGYCSDLTRMIFVGSIPRKIGEIYKIVLDAQLAAIAQIKPGRRMCDIDAVARNVIKKAGFGDQFSHGLGHGLGLDVHEPPSLSWRSDEALAPGMVVTVEPGIYVPGGGGVRIEDDVLVTNKGHRVLSRLDKTLEGAVL